MSPLQRARLVVALAILNLVLVAAALAVGVSGGWVAPDAAGAIPTPSGTAIGQSAAPPAGHQAVVGNLASG